MNINEEKAKTKWCPFIRFHGVPSDDSLSNRDSRFDRYPDPFPTSCIGSACMAWRWESPISTSSDGNEARDSRFSLGHCGLAGKP